MIVELLQKNTSGITVQSRNGKIPIVSTQDVAVKLDGVDISSLVTRMSLELDAHKGVPEIHLSLIPCDVENKYAGKVIVEFLSNGRVIKMECVAVS